MTTQVIAVGNTETAFADGEFTIAAGTNVTLMIKGAADGGIPVEVPFALARKASGGQYTLLTTLTSNNILDLGNISGGSESVTYAVRRPTATTNSAGIDKA